MTLSSAMLAVREWSRDALTLDLTRKPTPTPKPEITHGTGWKHARIYAEQHARLRAEVQGVGR